MTKKLLITYGSWAESTKEVAQNMAEIIRTEKNFEVDVKPAKEVKDLSPYQGVIIGSAIRAGMFHSSVPKFIKKFHKDLSNKPSVFFICCLTMKDDTEGNRKEAASYLEKLYSKTPDFKPIDVGLFGGAVNYKKLPFLFRKMFEKSDEMAEGDFRDWNKINKWGLDISEKISLPN